MEWLSVRPTNLANVIRQSVSQKPLSKKMLDHIFKSAWERSEYSGTATVHAIRRYIAKKVNVRLSRKINAGPVLLGSSPEMSKTRDLPGKQNKYNNR